MAYKEKSSKGKFMDNAVGLCSTPTNPMPMANQVSPMCGNGSSMNSDQAKANKLLQQAHMERDSLRGKSGM